MKLKSLAGVVWMLLLLTILVADQYVTLREGEGISARVPLGRG